MTGGAAMAQVETAAAGARADARAWSAPVIDGTAVASARGRRMTEAQREEERRFFAEAEAAGRAAGLAAAQKEMAPRLAQLEERTRTVASMLDALSKPLAQLDDVVHDQVATLALLIARAVVRRELRADPSQIIGMVREAVALLPASGRGARVALHPEDAALVRERLTPSGPEAAWSIIEDPALARGDCRVHTDYARLDARIETRLHEALVALLGEERARPRGAEPA
jgi:flagellar assembly protein FliH